ncbi:hypothetical protein CFP56_011801, partial [Quercus suber]
KGFCQYGDSCKYVHPKNNLANVNTQGISVTGFVDNNVTNYPWKSVGWRQFFRLNVVYKLCIRLTAVQS